MPNFKTHAKVGVIAGAGIAACKLFVDYKKTNVMPDLEKVVQALLKGVAFGFLGGIAADILEPATNPNHRNLFHSWVAFFSITYIGGKTLKNKDHDGFDEILQLLCGGYLSHLIMDAQTPKSLPIIVK